jgi:A/G-specific adenine glycosylase
MKKISRKNKEKDKKFVKTVWDYYAKWKRDFPWRNTTNPYHILVSEVMLQQTQTFRVVPKYEAFLKAFPTPAHLAKASLGEVLALWHGLGYNRRARYLKLSAEALIARGKKNFPNTYDELVSLPGIGPYTAAAILAFAFNIPYPLIETNIRSVYIHHYFPRSQKVPDEKLKPIIARTLDAKSPREWYAALMDYGAMLKSLHGNPSRKSAHHAQQSTFKGSTRALRGAAVKALLAGPLSNVELHKTLAAEKEKVEAILSSLQRDGIITHQNARWQIA